MSVQRALETSAPREAQLGINVDDGHAGFDRLLKILVARSRTAVQRHENAAGILDFADPLTLETLLGFTADHALHQSVHISNSRREYVNSGGIDELFRFHRSRKHAYPGREL